MKMNADAVTLISRFLHTTLLASIVFAQKDGTFSFFAGHLSLGNLTPQEV
jgi:hypothetical protein